MLSIFPSHGETMKTNAIYSQDLRKGVKGIRQVKTRSQWVLSFNLQITEKQWMFLRKDCNYTLKKQAFWNSYSRGARERDKGRKSKWMFLKQWTPPRVLAFLSFYKNSPDWLFRSIHLHINRACQTTSRAGTDLVPSLLTICFPCMPIQ